MGRVDPWGLDYAIYVNPNGAGGNGHTTLYFQSNNGTWYSYDQGAAGNPSDSSMASGSSTRAGVGITSNTFPPEGSVYFPTNRVEDNQISQCAYDSQASHNSGKSKYNLFTNNCTDAIADVLSCAGIKIYNPSFTIKPNSWINELLDSFNR